MTEAATGCVLLAARHHGFAEGLRGLLETAFDVVVMVADEPSLLDVAGRMRPDCVVVDLPLSGDGRLDWLQALRQRWPALKVVVVSGHREASAHRFLLDAGADAHVLKRSVATDLLPAVEQLRAPPPVGSGRPA